MVGTRIPPSGVVVSTEADRADSDSGRELSAYNSVAQLRNDIWWHIADTARRLAVLGPDAGTEVAELERYLADADLLEPYHSYPGGRLVARAHELAGTGAYAELTRLAETIGRGLVGGAALAAAANVGDRAPGVPGEGSAATDPRPNFDILVVADLSDREDQRLREEIRAIRRPEDEAVYDVVVAPSVEDAVVAALVNSRIQAVVVRSDFRTRSMRDRTLLDRLVSPVESADFDRLDTAARVSSVARALRSLRPELDLYLVDNASIELLAAQLGQHFDSVFLLQEDVLDLHLTILRGVARRRRTPFFSALTAYARKPTGVFHAMPISRGNSVVNPPWIRDMAEFYGAGARTTAAGPRPRAHSRLRHPVHPQDADRAAAGVDDPWFDDDFAGRAEAAFREAYMTHTSTSPNYQILASLDVGRRQVELEGFDLVARQVELAMTLRDRIAEHPLLSRYFRVLGSEDLIPERYRRSRGCPLHAGPVAMDEAWHTDEFVLDPCRLTLEIGATGIDGDTFKHDQLMDRWGVQVNKTTRNTVLAMTNIGTTRTSVAYLLRALVGIAEGLEDEASQRCPAAGQEFERRVHALTHEHPPLPNFSRFHDVFRTDPGEAAPDGDVRTAFYLAYDDDRCEYLPADQVRERLGAGQPVVSATFVTPYPPGFPVLVPGQEFSTDILDFMDALDTKEIHGLDPGRGYRVFTAAALAAVTAVTT
ncbi:hypothetical protein [Nocardia sp. NPDC004860]|uniref:hypothetical protein n=1 Tax=Nocardia sp. NPDC004860 TaxID=3154557 RepID=UPI0033BEFEE6